MKHATLERNKQAKDIKAMTNQELKENSKKLKRLMIIAAVLYGVSIAGIVFLVLN
tara:strand:+ start:1114 stop:1278 length:165 start_codon:yes stop_codon:yes gene_type:complete